MKKIFRKTGETVDVISYKTIHGYERNTEDCVSYIDSEGEEHEAVKGLNIYWDFEDVEVEEEPTKDIDWEGVRIKAAISAMNAAITAKWFSYIDDDEKQAFAISENAVLIADALIAELKKGGNQ